MKQALVITTFSAAVILTGCGKSKPEPKSKTEKVEVVSDWSCTHPENLNQIQTSLKKEYLKQIERSLRQSQANSNMRCDSFKSHMIINKLSKFL